MSETPDLAALLRLWRARIQPEEVGSPFAQGSRKTPGLRREEVAWLAGVSPDYVKRLEQGRAHPSAGVLRAISRALRLSDVEYELACRLAGHAAELGGLVPQYIDLRDVASRYPADRDLSDMITALRRSSPAFTHLWELSTVAHHGNERKTIDHPDAGELELDCDVLTVHGAELRIIVFTAAPGSEAADKLRLLSVLGSQDMSALTPARAR